MMLDAGYKIQDASYRMPFSRLTIHDSRMRLTLVIFSSILMISCSAQSRARQGVVKGKVEIGPLCPQEPCNPTPERLKQIYDSYQVVIMDTAAARIIFKIRIQQDATFNLKISAGEYIARIKPVIGEGFRSDSKRISIKKGKATDIFLTYDTGLR